MKADVAWYKGNFDRRCHAVANLQCNELGLYDMSGNVWEMTNDKDECGGSFGVDANSCTTLSTDLFPWGESYNSLGFRICRNA